MCLPEEPDDVSSMSPPLTNPAGTPANTNAESTDDAVKQLVKGHASGPANDCRAEAVALGAASIKTAVSLGAVLVSVPGELGLPLALGRFAVDALTLGVAAANYDNCKHDATAKPK
jgi:hypothetical protein